MNVTPYYSGAEAALDVEVILWRLLLIQPELRMKQGHSVAADDLEEIRLAVVMNGGSKPRRVDSGRNP